MNSKLLWEVLQNVSQEVQAESTRIAREITAATYAAVPLTVPEAYCPLCRQPVRASLYRESDPDAPCADCAAAGGDSLIDAE